MRRLTAEEVRDSILAVAGTLNSKAGGPPVYPPIPREVLAGPVGARPGLAGLAAASEAAGGASTSTSSGRSWCRSWRRTTRPTPTLSCPVRYTTTVPTQALGLLNGAFANEQAARFAEPAPARGTRATSRPGPTRTPAHDRREARRRRGAAATSRSSRALQTDGGLDAATALTQYCLLILNANAFLYLD